MTDEVRVCAALLGADARSFEPLGPRTTYRVGGPADLFIELDSESLLERVAAAVVASGVEVLVVGNGSNLLIADAGFRGLAIHLGGTFAGLTIDEHGGRVVAGAALSYPVLARQSVASGLGGLEWAVGIPGTVGGAVTMNAGGHGSATEMNLLDATLVDLVTGEQRCAEVDTLACSYRHTAVDATTLVVRATFRTEPHSDREESLALIDEIVRWRREHQPGGHNCGSVFTNPVGDSAGRLIEAAGLKGRRLGSAEVSTKHANFIQSDPGGTAADVRRLIDLVRDRVRSESGIELETELRIVGFDRP
jgi:UDP-N-acetylmuramate dehydrogenase